MKTIAKTAAKVFVIEDEPMVRQIIRSLVDAMGLEVEEYENAEHFLSAFFPDNPGCIVAGVRLSGMSGIELLEQLSEYGNAIPAVLITSVATTQTIVRAMRNGAIAVFDRPFEKDKISQAIRDALQEDAINREKQIQIAELQSRFSLLTDLERSVLQLMVSGNINRRIAEQLNVSVRTIEKQRHQIFKKTHTRTIGQLAWHAMLLRAEGFESFSVGPNKAPSANNAAST